LAAALDWPFVGLYAIAVGAIIYCLISGLFLAGDDGGQSESHDCKCQLKWRIHLLRCRHAPPARFPRVGQPDKYGLPPSFL
jgi:hypothetical protein